MTQRLHSIEDKISECLLDQRRIFLSAAVDSDSAQDIIRQLWYLDHQKAGEEILFVINSPGGSVDAGLAIWDHIQLLKSPVTTLISGLAASMGSVLSLAAAPGKRLATARSRIMIHQPSLSGYIQGQATDLLIHAKEIKKTRASLVELYAKSTGKSPEEIDAALDRDTWMSAEEALDFGLLDRILGPNDRL